MRYLLIAIGTRGDIEPFLAIGQELHKKGNDVLCLFPEQFRDLVLETHLPFEGLNSAFLELIYGAYGKAVMGGKVGFWKKIAAYIRLFKESIPINKVLLDEQYRITQEYNPDRILYSGKALYGPIWGSLNKGKAFLISPIPCLIHSTATYPHVGFTGNYGAFLNRLSYGLANWGLLKNIKSSTKIYRAKLGVSMGDVKRQLFKSDMLYAVSPALFNRPKDISPKAHFVGYHQRVLNQNWEPHIELQAFIHKHERVALITFGSMLNPRPEINSALILGILDLLKIPTIVNTYAGGLQKPDKVNQELFCFVESIPYEWAFPKVYGVIHHGGSGTTHMAAKHGCVQLIIPHIIDQFLWNQVVANKGLGSKGRSIRKLNKSWLEKGIKDLWENETYKATAKKLSEDINTEDMMDKYLDLIE